MRVNGGAQTRGRSGLTRSQLLRGAGVAAAAVTVGAGRAPYAFAGPLRFGGRWLAGDLSIVATERAWVAPNDSFGGPRLDAPAETLRLAWAVQLAASGALADRLRAVEVWIDAGDGQVLGGDLVE